MIVMAMMIVLMVLMVAVAAKVLMVTQSIREKPKEDIKTY